MQERCLCRFKHLTLKVSCTFFMDRFRKNLVSPVPRAKERSLEVLLTTFSVELSNSRRSTPPSPAWGQSRRTTPRLRLDLEIPLSFVRFRWSKGAHWPTKPGRTRQFGTNTVFTAYFLSYLLSHKRSIRYSLSQLGWSFAYAPHREFQLHSLNLLLGGYRRSATRRHHGSQPRCRRSSKLLTTLGYGANPSISSASSA